MGLLKCYLDTSQITHKILEDAFLEVLNLLLPANKDKTQVRDDFFHDGLEITLHTYTSECRGHNQAKDFLSIIYTNEDVLEQMDNSQDLISYYEELSDKLNNLIDKDVNVMQAMESISKKYPRLCFWLGIEYIDNIRLILFVSQ